jgi:hypothetical protein
MNDHDRAYRILGLEENASLDEIEEAHRELIAVWQPDRFKDDPGLREKAETRQLEIEKAYTFLRESHSKRTYRTDSNPRKDGNQRGPSLLDDTFSERMDKSKRRFAVWIALFGLVAVAVVINFLTWSPVEVEDEPEPSETEKIISDVRAAGSNEVDADEEEVMDSAEDKAEEPPLQVQPSVSLPAARPEEPVQERAAPPARPKIAPPPPIEQPPSPETVPEIPEEAEAEVDLEEEPAVSELAERSFQILRAKSDLANQLVEGTIVDYRYEQWKAVERSASEVYVDLIAEAVADGREVHFVWAVDVESQTVKAMSQAARDLVAAKDEE